jgi:hypothetical protein
MGQQWRQFSFILTACGFIGRLLQVILAVETAFGSVNCQQVKQSSIPTPMTATGVVAVVLVSFSLTMVDLSWTIR